jgi:hypothetical protein
LRDGKLPVGEEEEDVHRVIGVSVGDAQGASREPGVSGFSPSNLWRMTQFFDTYRRSPKLAPLVRELTWSHNLLIFGRCKRDEEREFYLRTCIRERWNKRALERQLAPSLFEAPRA